MIKRAHIIAASLMILATGAEAAKKIVVDLSTQTATAYENGSAVFSGHISTGTAKRPTPTGSFRVLEKDIDHVSNRWPKPNGGAKMHYMLRLTRYGIAMHLGYVPNYPASHGCIRMQNGFAQRMYKWARVGTPIRVVGHAPARVYRAPRPRKIKQKKLAVVPESIVKQEPLYSPVNPARSVAKKQHVLPQKVSVLDVLNGSPKAQARVAKARKSRPGKVQNTPAPSKHVVYKKPTTLDVLSSSPKAAQRVKAAQKAKWKNKPKRKSPRVDPLKVLRG